VNSADSTTTFWAAVLFGAVVGWFIYYINRYRKGDVQLSDITTLLGAIGGGFVAKLTGAAAFNGYAIGVAAGFFGYFLVLVILVALSKEFSADWFLDGRRKRPAEPWYIPDGTTVSARPASAPPVPLPAAPASMRVSAAPPTIQPTELVVKFRDVPPPPAVLPPGAAEAAVVGVPASLPESQLLAQAEHISFKPLFPSLIRPAMALPPSSEGRGPASFQTHQRFFTVQANAQRHHELARKLRACADVETAYVKPIATPPLAPRIARPAAAPTAPTPSFEKLQGYLGPAPNGVAAEFAAGQPGGDGLGVHVIDIEGAWNLLHEELAGRCRQVGGTMIDDQGWRNHGTAVLGILAGPSDGRGVTGIARNCSVAVFSQFDSTLQSQSASAIVAAADQLKAGDILLLEMHRPGPRNQFANRDDQLGFIPVEWWEEDFLAIQYATAKGIIVIEAGGNGNEWLDDVLYDTPADGFSSTWRNPFRRGAVDSGAILVGAGAPPPGTNGMSYGPNCSRLSFSNYGSAVDAQGWGEQVTSCGYGDLQDGDESVWYTKLFSGTSSASPMIAGVVACLQGNRLAAGKRPLTFAQARALLRATGTPQASGPNGPATQRIGNRPDLTALLARSAEIP
jgi:hypothetical protein